MFPESRITKFIACLILTAFTYSFVLHEPIYGLTMLVREGKEAREITDKLESFVLPYRYGRIMGGEHRSPSRLIVYIQDLHCHPEVQKNIYEIIRFFDQKYGVNKILVEGAPCGRVDTSILGAISNETVKQKTLQALLDKGLLSGAEYYSVIHKEDKLYGLEQWDVYEQNLTRIRGLLEDKEKNGAVAQELKDRLDEAKAKYLSQDIKRLIRRLHPADEKAKESARRYLVLEKLGVRVKEDVGMYPNLSRYIEMLRLNKETRFRRLPGELSRYVAELKSMLPYRVYQALMQKLEQGGREEEYYLALSEVAQEYTSCLATRFPDVAKFLEYVRLNNQINPIYLVSEEQVFCERVLQKRAKRLADKELLLLSRMADIFKNVVELKVTPEEYDYFLEHKDDFRVLVQKFVPFADLKEPFALLDDQELFVFYDTNLFRNDVFVKNVLTQPSHPHLDPLPSRERKHDREHIPSPLVGGRWAEPASEEECQGEGTIKGNYRTILSNIEAFDDIEIVVAGGFHSQITRSMGDVSYLAITPNVTRDFNESIYEKVLTGKITPRDIQGSAFAPVLTSVGLTHGQAMEKVAELAAVLETLVRSRGVLTHQEAMDTIRSFIENLNRELEAQGNGSQNKLEFRENRANNTFSVAGKDKIVVFSVGKHGNLTVESIDLKERTAVHDEVGTRQDARKKSLFNTIAAAVLGFFLPSLLGAAASSLILGGMAGGALGFLTGGIIGALPLVYFSAQAASIILARYGRSRHYGLIKEFEEAKDLKGEEFAFTPALWINGELRVNKQLMSRMPRDKQRQILRHEQLHASYETRLKTHFAASIAGQAIIEEAIVALAEFLHALGGMIRSIATKLDRSITILKYTFSLISRNSHTVIPGIDECFPKNVLDVPPIVKDFEPIDFSEMESIPLLDPRGFDLPPDVFIQIQPPMEVFPRIDLGPTILAMSREIAPSERAITEFIEHTLVDIINRVNAKQTIPEEEINGIMQWIEKNFGGYTYELQSLLRTVISGTGPIVGQAMYRLNKRYFLSRNYIIDDVENTIALLRIKRNKNYSALTEQGMREIPIYYVEEITDRDKNTQWWGYSRDGSVVIFTDLPQFTEKASKLYASLQEARKKDPKDLSIEDRILLRTWPMHATREDILEDFFEWLEMHEVRHAFSSIIQGESDEAGIEEETSANLAQVAASENPFYALLDIWERAFYHVRTEGSLDRTLRRAMTKFLGTEENEYDSIHLNAEYQALHLMQYIMGDTTSISDVKGLSEFADKLLALSDYELRDLADEAHKKLRGRPAVEGPLMKIFRGPLMKAIDRFIKRDLPTVIKPFASILSGTRERIAEKAASGESLRWYERLLHWMGDPIRGAPLWELVFSIPVLAMAVAGSQALLLAVALTGIVFAAAHPDRTFRQQAGLFAVGSVLALVTIIPTVLAATLTGGLVMPLIPKIIMLSVSAASGLGFNYAAHRFYNIRVQSGAAAALASRLHGLFGLRMLEFTTASIISNSRDASGDILMRKDIPLSYYYHGTSLFSLKGTQQAKERGAGGFQIIPRNRAIQLDIPLVSGEGIEHGVINGNMVSVTCSYLTARGYAEKYGAGNKISREDDSALLTRQLGKLEERLARARPKNKEVIQLQIREMQSRLAYLQKYSVEERERHKRESQIPIVIGMRQKAEKRIPKAFYQPPVRYSETHLMDIDLKDVDHIYAAQEHVALIQEFLKEIGLDTAIEVLPFDAVDALYFSNNPAVKELAKRMARRIYKNWYQESATEEMEDETVTLFEGIVGQEVESIRKHVKEKFSKRDAAVLHELFLMMLENPSLYRRFDALLWANAERRANARVERIPRDLSKLMTYYSKTKLMLIASLYNDFIAAAHDENLLEAHRAMRELVRILWDRGGRYGRGYDKFLRALEDNDGDALTRIAKELIVTLHEYSWYFGMDRFMFGDVTGYTTLLSLTMTRTYQWVEKFMGRAWVERHHRFVEIVVAPVYELGRLLRITLDSLKGPIEQSGAFKEFLESHGPDQGDAEIEASVRGTKQIVRATKAGALMGLAAGALSAGIALPVLGTISGMMVVVGVPAIIGAVAVASAVFANVFTHALWNLAQDVQLTTGIDGRATPEIRDLAVRYLEQAAIQQDKGIPLVVFNPNSAVWASILEKLQSDADPGEFGRFMNALYVEAEKVLLALNIRPTDQERNAVVGRIMHQLVAGVPQGKQKAPRLRTFGAAVAAGVMPYGFNALLGLGALRNIEVALSNTPSVFRTIFTKTVVKVTGFVLAAVMAVAILISQPFIREGLRSWVNPADSVQVESPAVQNIYYPARAWHAGGGLKYSEFLKTFNAYVKAFNNGTSDREGFLRYAHSVLDEVMYEKVKELMTLMHDGAENNFQRILEKIDELNMDFLAAGQYVEISMNVVSNALNIDIYLVDDVKAFKPVSGETVYQIMVTLAEGKGQPSGTLGWSFRGRYKITIVAPEHIAREVVLKDLLPLLGGDKSFNNYGSKGNVNLPGDSFRKIQSFVIEDLRKGVGLNDQEISNIRDLGVLLAKRVELFKQAGLSWDGSLVFDDSALSAFSAEIFNNGNDKAGAHSLVNELISNNNSIRDFILANPVILDTLERITLMLADSTGIHEFIHIMDPVTGESKKKDRELTAYMNQLLHSRTPVIEFISLVQHLLQGSGAEQEVAEELIEAFHKELIWNFGIPIRFPLAHYIEILKELAEGKSYEEISNMLRKAAEKALDKNKRIKISRKDVESRYQVSTKNNYFRNYYIRKTLPRRSMNIFQQLYDSKAYDTLKAKLHAEGKLGIWEWIKMGLAHPVISHALGLGPLAIETGLLSGASALAKYLLGVALLDPTGFSLGVVVAVAAIGAAFALVHPDLYERGISRKERSLRFMNRFVGGMLLAAPFMMFGAVWGTALSAGLHFMWNLWATKGLPGHQYVRALSMFGQAQGVKSWNSMLNEVMRKTRQPLSYAYHGTSLFALKGTEAAYGKGAGGYKLVPRNRAEELGIPIVSGEGAKHGGNVGNRSISSTNSYIVARGYAQKFCSGNTSNTIIKIDDLLQEQARLTESIAKETKGSLPYGDQEERLKEISRRIKYLKEYSLEERREHQRDSSIPIVLGITKESYYNLQKERSEYENYYETPLQEVDLKDVDHIYVPSEHITEVQKFLQTAGFSDSIEVIPLEATDTLMLSEEPLIKNEAREKVIELSYVKVLEQLAFKEIEEKEITAGFAHIIDGELQNIKKQVYERGNIQWMSAFKEAEQSFHNAIKENSIEKASDAMHAMESVLPANVRSAIIRGYAVQLEALVESEGSRVQTSNHMIDSNMQDAAEKQVKTYFNEMTKSYMEKLNIREIAESVDVENSRLLANPEIWLPNDLAGVGQDKPVGYITWESLKRLSALLVWGYRKGLGIAIVPHVKVTGDVAIYFYDRSALSILLQEYADVLEKAGVPVDIEGFVDHIAHHTVDADIYPEAYRVVGLAFGDRRFISPNPDSIIYTYPDARGNKIYMINTAGYGDAGRSVREMRFTSYTDALTEAEMVLARRQGVSRDIQDARTLGELVLIVESIYNNLPSQDEATKQKFHPDYVKKIVNGLRKKDKSFYLEHLSRGMNTPFAGLRDKVQELLDGKDTRGSGRTSGLAAKLVSLAFFLILGAGLFSNASAMPVTEAAALVVQTGAQRGIAEIWSQLSQLLIHIVPLALLAMVMALGGRSAIAARAGRITVKKELDRLLTNYRIAGNDFYQYGPRTMPNPNAKALIIRDALNDLHEELNSPVRYFVRELDDKVVLLGSDGQSLEVTKDVKLEAVYVLAKLPPGPDPSTVIYRDTVPKGDDSSGLPISVEDDDDDKRKRNKEKQSAPRDLGLHVTVASREARNAARPQTMAMRIALEMTIDQHDDRLDVISGKVNMLVHAGEPIESKQLERLIALELNAGMEKPLVLAMGTADSTLERLTPETEDGASTFVVPVKTPEGRMVYIGVDLRCRRVYTQERGMGLAVYAMPYREPGSQSEKAQGYLEALNRGDARVQADFLARVALALAAEKNEGGVFEKAFERLEYDGEVWGAEFRNDQALVDAMNNAVYDVASAGRDAVVYGVWNPDTRDKEYLLDQITEHERKLTIKAMQERDEAAGKGDLERTRGVIKADSVLAVGPLDNVERVGAIVIGDSKAQVRTMILGMALDAQNELFDLGIDPRAVVWERAAEDFLRHSKPSPEVADRIKQLVGELSRMRDRVRTERELDSASLAAWLESAEELARILAGEGYLNTVQKSLAGENKTMIEQADALAVMRGARLGVPVSDRERLIQLLGLMHLQSLVARLKEAGLEEFAPALGTVRGMQAGDYHERVIRAAMLWLDITGSVELDLTEMETNNPGEFLARLNEAVGIWVQAHPKQEPRVRILGVSDALESLVQEYGFRMEKASGNDLETMNVSGKKARIREQGRNGAAVQLDLNRTDAKALVEAGSSSGVEEVIYKLGAVTETGEVLTIPLAVDTEKGFGLFSLASLIAEKLHMSKVMTPRGRYEAGRYKGARDAERMPADVLAKLYASISAKLKGQMTSGPAVIMVRDILADAIDSGDMSSVENAIQIVRELDVAELAAAFTSIRKNIAGADQETRKVYVAEMVGTLDGVAGTLLYLRSGAARQERTSAQKQMLMTALIEGSRYIVYEKGTVRLNPAIDIMAALEVLPAILVILESDERVTLAGNIARSIRAQGAQDRALAALKLAEAVYRSEDDDLWNKMKGELKELAGELIDGAGIGRLSDEELVYRLNFMTIVTAKKDKQYERTLRQAQLDAYRDALSERVESLRRTDPGKAAELTLLVLTLSMGELLTAADLTQLAGSLEVQRRHVEESTENPFLRARAQRAILLRENLTAAQAEATLKMRLEGLMNLAAWEGSRSEGMLGKRFDRRSVSAAIALFMELPPILKEQDLRQATKEGANAATLELIRQVLTAG